MHTRDASGRQVSLLNDEPVSHGYGQHGGQASIYRPSNRLPPHSYHGVLGRSPSSSPNTPELLRSDSYDSQMSGEPLSPMTPIHDYGRIYTTVSDVRASYEDYTADVSTYSTMKGHDGFASRRSTSYDDEPAPHTISTSADRPGKRYPCRYRESHGCEKTFTTSGHASRHSKIHTAEKAVQCTFSGCSKKFTRADNMKQHLETHYKDRSRSSTGSSLSVAERRSSASSKTSSRNKGSSATATRSNPLSPPSGAWDMRDLGLPLLGRPGAARTPSSGLDALAMAVACQESS